MGDIFDMFFGGRGGGGGGGGRGRGGGDRQKKAPPIKLPLDVTLEDLFVGATKNMDFKRFTLCRKCEGKGGSKVVECSECNGQGVVIQIQRMGYMTLQQQRPCTKCEGEGTTIKESDKCKQCDGKGLKEQHETVLFFFFFFLLNNKNFLSSPFFFFEKKKKIDLKIMLCTPVYVYVW
ncbi:DnaJ domain containing protein [Reticulomyxa filosa]|uniref:DnaJ domain containing protein n=1 Tax=Reticulomyxa filosa TaxID=46433 RepID=X6MT53_RETFI|nr:DnaJ domain containing protein [Reticulomyxa filosa]|eukprot:ETO17004.1 DnaJ domain containing protein [Reticulomyxa filosa]